MKKSNELAEKAQIAMKWIAVFACPAFAVLTVFFLIQEQLNPAILCGFMAAVFFIGGSGAFTRLRIFGIEAEMQAKIDQADRVLAALRSFAMVSTELLVKEASHVGEWGGSNLTVRRESLREASKALMELGISAPDVERAIRYAVRLPCLRAVQGAINLVGQYENHRKQALRSRGEEPPPVQRKILPDEFHYATFLNADVFDLEKYGRYMVFQHSDIPAEAQQIIWELVQKVIRDAQDSLRANTITDRVIEANRRTGDFGRDREAANERLKQVAEKIEPSA